MEFSKTRLKPAKTAGTLGEIRKSDFSEMHQECKQLTRHLYDGNSKREDNSCINYKQSEMDTAVT
jgi:hypothetical protein